MRRFITGVVAVGACLLLLGSWPGDAQPLAPVKIGMLVPLTGVFTRNGREAVDGTRLYFDEIGWKVSGRTIELLVEDYEGKPDVGLTKARKLVERDGVHMLKGIVSSAVGLAVAGYAKEKKIPIVVSADFGVSSLTMPGPLLNPYVFRWSQSGTGPGQAAADWAYKVAGWRKVVTIGSDYVGGLEVNGSFARVFCSLGGRVVQELWPPLGTPDFAPYITQIDRSADAVVVFAAGTDGLRFGRQYPEYGVTLPLMDLYAQITDEANLAQFGDASLGWYSTIHYTALIETPENKRFVAAWEKRYRRVPFDNAADGYVGAKAIAEAVKAVNGKVEDRDAFMAAMRKLEFDSPKGVVKLDQFQNIVQPQYVRKVERVGSTLVNTPVKTYSSVSQFWTWTPEEFMKYPAWAEFKGRMTDCSKVLGR
ncbi:MAG: ABC transporter substrate-binding protein [Candidatus Rokuibacteriota bacterium]|nr:MAG: ABC transporter substrate-binding protein [Candidatus Rokubacteria bacterium]